MNLINLRRIKGALLLDGRTYKELMEDKKALPESAFVVFAAWTIGSFPTLFYEPRFAIVLLFSIPLIWTISSAVLHIIARLLGGNSGFRAYLRATGYCHIPHVLGLVNFLEFIRSDIGAASWLTVIVPAVVYLWTFLCLIIATKETHRISTFKAAVTVVMPTAFLLLFLVMLSGMVIMSASLAAQTQ